MSRPLDPDPGSEHGHDPLAGTVHLVYPHGLATWGPDAIGRHLGERLERHYTVAYHDWTERAVITPKDGDILVGHPHPSPSTVFRRSCRRRGWRRIVMLSPFNTDPSQVAFLDDVIGDCDLYLAISGPHWFADLKGSRYSHWVPKMRRLDMAVDRADYPPIKTSFNGPGSRRLVYIGHTGRAKNTTYLTEIAGRLPGVEMAWVGRGHRPIRGLTELGWLDYATPEGRERIARFDFLITVGSADANPTTILEAMSWGIIPICTPQSGYEGIPGIINIPLGDPDAAAAIIRGGLDRPSDELAEIQRANWALLDRDYTWERFTDRVVSAIESDERPPLGTEGRVRRAWLIMDSTRSRAAWQARAVRAAPRQLVRALRRRARRGIGVTSWM